MSNLSRYQGIGQSGPAYKVMFENDAHTSGSVDCILLENMVKLCSETADYLYKEYTPTRSCYERGSRPVLERCVEKATGGPSSKEDRVEAIAQFTSNLQDKVSDDLDAIRLGGTEEEIIARGSDWCTDVARVGCALSQVAGFSARIVYLADLGRAYRGHAIMEVYRAEAWGAVDALTNVVYRRPNGRPASTWDLIRDQHLIKRHSRGRPTLYTTVDQFRAAAISNYFVCCWREYDYTVSKVNDYYRSILEMALQDWPGGLRWLHRERE